MEKNLDGLRVAVELDLDDGVGMDNANSDNIFFLNPLLIY